MSTPPKVDNISEGEAILPSEAIIDAAHSSSSYEVGRNRPPVGTRFQKGHAYLPPRAKSGGSLTDAIRKLQSKLRPVGTSEGVEYWTPLDLLVEQTLEAALSGDIKARHEMFELYRRADAAERNDAVPISIEGAERIKANFAARAREAGASASPDQILPARQAGPEHEGEEHA